MISSKLKRQISEADISCKVHSVCQQRKETSVRNDWQDKDWAWPSHEVSRHSLPGATALLIHLPGPAAYGKGHGKVGITAVKENEGKNQAQLQGLLPLKQFSFWKKLQTLLLLQTAVILSFLTFLNSTCIFMACEYLANTSNVPNKLIFNY